jgi:hypothetical protein
VSTISEFEHYKHDIVGKFKTIEGLVATMDQHSFDRPEDCEIFYAVHEVLIKMVDSSRSILKSQIKAKKNLQITKDFQETLPQLKIAGLLIRYKINPTGGILYIYSTAENTLPPEKALVILECLLPMSAD